MAHDDFERSVGALAERLDAIDAMFARAEKRLVRLRRRIEILTVRREMLISRGRLGASAREDAAALEQNELEHARLMFEKSNLDNHVSYARRSHEAGMRLLHEAAAVVRGRPDGPGVDGSEIAEEDAGAAS